MSDGIKDNLLYALVNNQNHLYEIDLKKRAFVQRTAGNSYNFSFGSLYDTILINTGYDDFIVIGRFYNGSYWFAYSYKNDKWTNPSNWVIESSYGTSIFFEPDTYRLFYRINGREFWEYVDFSETKVKGKEISVDEEK